MEVIKLHRLPQKLLENLGGIKNIEQASSKVIEKTILEIEKPVAKQESTLKTRILRLIRVKFMYFLL